ncbi:hypothetical protein [Actinomadura rupiterrae]|uniref:hypothetical protein n=1 Tax=Actinomadura rupiterrae TaxID=559627 RepID=UPI0020A524D5|nr:hypothetical protein [Actinomadura rupiterrae]MCP2343710.1 hypothetical protein [Actinomadura rupiterrae]
MSDAQAPFTERRPNGTGAMHLRFGFYLHADAFWPEQQIRNWRQRNWEAVQQMVATCGTIIDSYLDDATLEVPSDLTPWKHRPQAGRLLGDLGNGTLDAVAVGTIHHRTFAATPIWDVVALLARHGTQLWTADVNGPLLLKPDPADAAAPTRTRQNRKG